MPSQPNFEMPVAWTHITLWGWSRMIQSAAAPTPNISAQVPTNVSMVSCGFEPMAMSALTPKAGVMIKINENVRPKAMPMAAWLASSRSTDGLSSADGLLVCIGILRF